MSGEQEILAKIQKLQSSYVAMVTILQSVSSHIANIPLIGTDELDTILEWQMSLNGQIKEIRQIIDMQRNLLDLQRSNPCLECPMMDQDSPDEDDLEDEDDEDESEPEELDDQASREKEESKGKPSDFLVVEDRKKPSTWHLPVKRNGKPDHTLMGAAWAALHGGYRGNKYEGPKKAEAISKLKALYKREKMPLPSEKSEETADDSNPYQTTKDLKNPHSWKFVKKDGKVDKKALDEAWTMLNKNYKGADKEEQLTNIKELYKREKLPIPSTD